MNSKAMLLFVIICFSLNENNAQNKLDASGRKFGKWVFKGKDHPSSNYVENHKVAVSYTHLTLPTKVRV